MSDSREQSSPEHVAVIMDGNGRWAKRRGLPRIEGHRRGVQSIRHLMQAARKHGVRYLTLYAFSVENWNRPSAEVNALMELLSRAIREYRKDLDKHQVQLATIGDRTALPTDVQKALSDICEATAHHTEGTLILALNYGARQEVIRACRRLIEDSASGAFSPGELEWEHLRQRLDTNRWPDPDLVIRTSGEQRMSNFLLLQCAYAEFITTEVAWPEFREAHFADALAAFEKRERRFGQTGEQVHAPALTS